MYGRFIVGLGEIGAFVEIDEFWKNSERGSGLVSWSSGADDPSCRGNTSTGSAPPPVFASTNASSAAHIDIKIKQLLEATQQQNTTLLSYISR
jgi:hypothetical protein